MILRQKIFESQDLEILINSEKESIEDELAKEIFSKAAKHVEDIRDDCYNIARKLKLK